MNVPIGATFKEKKAIEILDSMAQATYGLALGEHYRLLVMSDHATPNHTTHSAGLFLFIYDNQIKTGCGLPFDERTAHPLLSNPGR